MKFKPKKQTYTWQDVQIIMQLDKELEQVILTQLNEKKFREALEISKSMVKPLSFKKSFKTSENQ